MRRTSAELKRLSREQLNGHWGLAIGVNLLMQLITTALLMPFYFLFVFSGGGMVQYVTYMVATIIISAVSIVIQCGIMRIYMGFARGEEVSLGMMFSEFTRRPDRYILGYLLLFAIDFACVLPGSICMTVGLTAGTALAIAIGVSLYLAGVIVMVLVSLGLSQVFLLLIEDEELKVMEAFRKSSEMMVGSKGRLFYIDLSYIGWVLLGVLSCGIGMLWVMPYITQVSINFYRELTGELDAAKEEPESHIDLSV